MNLDSSTCESLLLMLDTFQTDGGGTKNLFKETHCRLVRFDRHRLQRSPIT